MSFGRSGAKIRECRVNDAIVRDGKVVLSHLPFADGQHVRITVSESQRTPQLRRTIQQVREILKRGVVRFDDPTEPMIPSDTWEMLK